MISLHILWNLILICSDYQNYLTWFQHWKLNCSEESFTLYLQPGQINNEVAGWIIYRDKTEVRKTRWDTSSHIPSIPLSLYSHISLFPGWQHFLLFPPSFLSFWRFFFCPIFTSFWFVIYQSFGFGQVHDFVVRLKMLNYWVDLFQIVKANQVL